MVEQGPFKPLVVGSSPSGGTIFGKYLLIMSEFHKKHIGPSQKEIDEMLQHFIDFFLRGTDMFFMKFRHN